MRVYLLVWTFVHVDLCECMWVHKVVHDSMQICMIMCISVFLCVPHHEGMCFSWHSTALSMSTTEQQVLKVSLGPLVFIVISPIDITGKWKEFHNHIHTDSCKDMLTCTHKGYTYMHGYLDTHVCIVTSMYT